MLYRRRQLFLYRFFRLILRGFLLFSFLDTNTIFHITIVIVLPDPFKIRICEIIGAVQIFPHGGDRLVQNLFHRIGVAELVPGGDLRQRQRFAFFQRWLAVPIFGKDLNAVAAFAKAAGVRCEAANSCCAERQFVIQENRTCA